MHAAARGQTAKKTSVIVAPPLKPVGPAARGRPPSFLLLHLIHLILLLAGWYRYIDTLRLRASGCCRVSVVCCFRKKARFLPARRARGELRKRTQLLTRLLIDARRDGGREFLLLEKREFTLVESFKVNRVKK